MYKAINELLEKDQNELLTKDKQKHSVTYLEKITEVETFKKQAGSKRKESLNAIEEIEKQIGKLNEQYIMATDDKQMNKIKEQKAALRFELEDHKGLADTKYMYMIKEKLDGLGEYEQEATRERLSFNGEIDSKVKEYKDLIQLINDKIVQLNVLENKHVSRQIDSKLKRIKSKPDYTIGEGENKNKISGWN